MNKITIGVFPDRASAENAISGLRDLGIDMAHVSYIYVDRSGEIVETGGSSKGETAAGGAARGAVGGATTGALLGVIAGLVVANGILPGLGSLFVAGPLAAALGLSGAAATTAAGALTGAAAGGLIGALSGMGVSSSDAKVYEERVRKGGILVSAVSSNASVKNVFDRNGAEEIREYQAA